MNTERPTNHTHIVHVEKCWLCSCGQSELWIAREDEIAPRVEQFKVNHRGHGVMLEISPDIQAPWGVM